MLEPGASLGPVQAQHCWHGSSLEGLTHFCLSLELLAALSADIQACAAPMLPCGPVVHPLLQLLLTSQAVLPHSQALLLLFHLPEVVCLQRAQLPTRQLLQPLVGSDSALDLPNALQPWSDCHVPCLRLIVFWPSPQGFLQGK